MRIIFNILLFLSALLVAAPAQAEDNPFIMPMPFESGVIHYEARGAQKGKETLYFRKAGAERVKIVKTSGKIMFMTAKTDEISITNPDWITTVDLVKHEGMKMANPVKYYMEEYEKMNDDEKANVRKNVKEMGANFAQMFQGEVKPRAAKILGFECDVASVMGIETYSIADTPIALKTKGSMMGIAVDTEAIKFEKNVEPPDDVFEVPAGIDVVHNKEADEMNRQMVVSMMAKLKDPDAAENMKQGMDRSQQEMEEREQQPESETEEVRAEEPEETEQYEEQEEQPEEQDEEQDKGEKTKEMMKKGLEAIKGLF